MDGFITHRLPYEKVKEAYELLINGGPEVLGILLQWH